MSDDLVQNRKAFYDYEIHDTFESGICLVGTEIKSLRASGGSLQDAYVDVLEGELFLVNAFIAPYAQGNIHNHIERRKRKLLMHRKEIERLFRAKREKGFSIIPLSIYLTKKGIAKLRLATAKGKKQHDKRAALKEKASRRDDVDMRE